MLCYYVQLLKMLSKTPSQTWSHWFDRSLQLRHRFQNFQAGAELPELISRLET